MAQQNLHVVNEHNCGLQPGEVGLLYSPFHDKPIAKITNTPGHSLNIVPTWTIEVHRDQSDYDAITSDAESQQRSLREQGRAMIAGR
jgi:hypothetical protein